MGTQLIFQGTAGCIAVANHGYSGTTAVSVVANAGGTRPTASPALTALATMYYAVL